MARNEVLIRNLERRGRLLKKLSDEKIHKEIIIKPKFQSFLDRSYKKIESILRKEGYSDQDIENEINIINRKIFIILNRSASLSNNGKPNTGNITSMYGLVITKLLRNIPDFKSLKEFYEYIERNGIELKSVTGMQGGLGLPNISELNELVKWCNNNNIEFKSITGMQNGLGIPEIFDLEELITWCNNNNVELKSITGMQAGLGIPKIKKLDKLLEWSKNKNIDLKLITSMQAGLGIPKIEHLDNLIMYCNANNIAITNITLEQKGIPEHIKNYKKRGN